MKRRKKIWIPIVSAVLVVALGGGLAWYFTTRKGDAVNVYPVSNPTVSYWGDNATTYGTITTDKLQTVYLSNTQEVTEVYVQEGQQVAKGDPILAYDTTLSQLSLDRKDLEIQKTKLRLEDAKKQLAAIKKMKPISYKPAPPTTTTKPKPTEPVSLTPTRPLNDNERFMVLGKGSGNTAGDPKVLWIRQSQTFDESLMAEILGGAKKLYVILETREGDRPAGEVLSRIGVYFQVTETTEPDPTEPTDPPTTPTDPTTTPTESEPPESSGEPTETAQTTGQTRSVTKKHYSFTFFVIDGTEDPGQDDDGSSDNSGGQVDMNSGYTASEIAQMRSDKEKEIKDLEFSIRMAEAEYKIMQKEFDNGIVTSEIDGYVVGVLDPAAALSEGSPVVKVSGGGGFFIEGTVSELERSSLQIGQTVSVTSWNDGMSYDGTITSIGDYPSNNNYGYGSGNPNVSYYPFTVSIGEDANFQEGSGAEITYGTANQEDNGVYLMKAFVRTENNHSYVYVRNDAGELEKREVTTGGELWGEYIKITSGITEADSVAFPYGKALREGAPTADGNMDELYQGLYNY